MYKAWIGTYYQDLWPQLSGLLYSVRQKEKCPSTGRLHWQFFLIFSQRKRFQTVQRLLPGAHLEPARDLEKSRDYCMKIESRIELPIETGEFPKKVTSLNVVDLLRRSRPLDVLDQAPNLWRSFRTLVTLHSALLRPRREATSGLLLFGATGTGKSRIAHHIGRFLGTEHTFTADPALQWLDGYNGQPLIIVDEFRGTAPVSFLLRFIDRYPMMLPIKGGFVQMCATMVIFTSNLGLSEMYAGLDHPTLLALHRRINSYLVY